MEQYATPQQGIWVKIMPRFTLCYQRRAVCRKLRSEGSIGRKDDTFLGAKISVKTDISPAEPPANYPANPPAGDLWPTNPDIRLLPNIR